MESFDKLKALVEACEGDLAKVEAGNKSAGTRVRKSMQDIKSAAQVVRKDVMNLREN